MVPHTAVGPSCRRFLRAPCKNDGCRMSTFSNNSGKIGLDPFRQLLLPYRGKVRKEVVKGPAFGVDTAVIDLGNNLGLAVSSDPLSLIPSLGLRESAWLSVQLLVNDMATTGFPPQYAQFVLNLSPDTTWDQFSEYWKYIHQFCEEDRKSTRLNSSHVAISY